MTAFFLAHHARERAYQAENAMRKAILFRMAEEAEETAQLLYPDSAQNVSLESTAEMNADTRAAIKERCAVLIACAELLSDGNNTAADASDDAFRAAAFFYRALKQALPLHQNTAEYRNYAVRCANLLTALALTEETGNTNASQNEQTDGSGTPADAYAALAAFGSAFAPDSARLSSDTVASAHTYDGEQMISSADAAAILRGLPNCAGRFLAYNGTDAGIYRFSCQNGYAEISVHGGHLLRYAVYPRSAKSDSVYVTRALSDGDLSACCVRFLTQIGIPVSQNSQAEYEDRHGVRYFHYILPQNKNVYAGIRMSDGYLVYFDGEAYYKKSRIND